MKRSEGGGFRRALKPGSHGVIFLKSFRIVLVRQDELKTCACKKTCPEFYIINPYTFSDCELCCTRNRNVGYHKKYMNGGNTGVFKKYSVRSSTLMKTAAQPVFI